MKHQDARIAAAFRRLVEADQVLSLLTPDELTRAFVDAVARAGGGCFSIRGTRPTIVFDLDGTIADTMPALEAVGVELLRAAGVDDAVAAYRATIGRSFREQLELTRPGDPGHDETARQHVICHAHVYDTADLKPGARDALAHLARSHDVAIISASPTALVRAFLRRYDLGYPAYGSDSGDKATLLRRLRATVYVGDSPHDEAAAAEAGARFYALAGTFPATAFSARSFDMLDDLARYVVRRHEVLEALQDG